LIAHSYCEAVSIVTDTESTMIAAGQIFVQQSLKEGGTTKWLGCIDHFLQLVTQKAFSDLPMFIFFKYHNALHCQLVRDHRSLIQSWRLLHTIEVCCLLLCTSAYQIAAITYPLEGVIT